MTVATTTTSITVTGNGLVTTFSYDFPMGGSASYAQLDWTDGGGVTTTVAASNFSITGVTSSTGGTFTFPLAGSAITSGESLKLSRVLPLVQNTDIANQGIFAPAVITGALDYEMMATQQLQAEIDAIHDEIDTLTTSTGSGTVTRIATGSGLSGGPITTTGTITMTPITNGAVFGNFSGASAVPQAVTPIAGTGISISTTTTSMTIAATGAGGAGSYTLLASTTPSTTATVVFSSITSSYSTLKIIGMGRSTTTGTGTDAIAMTFNSDTGANYQRQFNLANVSTNSAIQGLTQSSLTAGEMPKTGDVANYPGCFEVTIPFYAGTTFYKSALVHYQTFNNSGVGSLFDITEAGCWASTSAISRIDLTLTGNWVTGSHVSLYGLT